MLVELLPWYCKNDRRDVQRCHSETGSWNRSYLISIQQCISLMSFSNISLNNAHYDSHRHIHCQFHHLMDQVYCTILPVLLSLSTWISFSPTYIIQMERNLQLVKDWKSQNTQWLSVNLFSYISVQFIILSLWKRDWLAGKLPLHVHRNECYSCASDWTRLLHRQLMTYNITSSPKSY
jgi:hypothetical protein